MAFVHESYALSALLVLTLILHSVGTAALIGWARGHLHGSSRQFRPLRSTILVIRLTGLIVCLHILEILLWACFLFLSVELLRRLGTGHLLLGGQLFDGRSLGPRSPANVANAVPDGKHHCRVDVRPLRRFSVCDRNPSG